MNNISKRIRTSDLGVMGPARYYYAILIKIVYTKLLTWMRLIYLLQVSILCPLGYEPSALPLRQGGLYNTKIYC